MDVESIGLLLGIEGCEMKWCNDEWSIVWPGIATASMLALTRVWSLNLLSELILVVVFPHWYVLIYLHTDFIMYKNVSLILFWIADTFLFSFLGWGEKSGFDTFMEDYIISILSLAQVPYWLIMILKMFN